MQLARSLPSAPSASTRDPLQFFNSLLRAKLKAEGPAPLSSPSLVLAMTFVALEYLGISLQRISLGALIIALGLLVDDAMIAIAIMLSEEQECVDP